ncbi:MAG: hypothetical protein HY815_33510 [Candidatus Riflebacteria bacterium]|nr:hypothetical protein [Candidatus Riflebacteria bacterium]
MAMWLGVVALIAFVLQSFVGQARAVLAQLVSPVAPLVLSVTVLWLLLHRCERPRRLQSFGASLGILVLVGAVYGLCENLASMSARSLVGLVGFGLLHAIASLGIVLALTWTSVICRERFSPLRFSGWLLATLWLIPAGACLLLGLVGTRVMPGAAAGPGWKLASVLGVALAGGFSVGLPLFFLLQSFMVLTYSNSLYRRRFCRAFHLPDPERSEALEQSPQQPVPSGLPGASSPEVGPAPAPDAASRP